MVILLFIIIFSTLFILFRKKLIFHILVVTIIFLLSIYIWTLFLFPQLATESSTIGYALFYYLFLVMPICAVYYCLATIYAVYIRAKSIKNVNIAGLILVLLQLVIGLIGFFVE